MNNDPDLAEFLAGGMFEPNYDYNMKKRALEKDTRLNKIKFSNIDAAYKELKAYEKSDVYRNTERAKQLLSKDFPVTNESLKDAMRRIYNLTEREYGTTLEQLANEKDVDVRMSLFDRVVKIKKK